MYLGKEIQVDNEKSDEIVLKSGNLVIICVPIVSLIETVEIDEKFLR